MVMSRSDFAFNKSFRASPLSEAIASISGLEILKQESHPIFLAEDEANHLSSNVFSRPENLAIICFYFIYDST